MKKEFEVRSSGGVATYIVEFSLESNKLHVYCNCPAGLLGKWCKHKLWLISGDFSGVLDTSDSSDLVEIQKWIGRSAFPRLLGEMKSAENEMQAAKLKINNIKKAMEKATQKGLEI